MALIEAMASGLPIIATEVSGTKQVMIPDETGLLIPPGSPHDLAEAMLKLLLDPELAGRMGAAARQRVEQGFSASKQAQEHIALYRREWNRSGESRQRQTSRTRYEQQQP
jgi:glycosyltransferase involved in cell wall biosynthesis